MTDTITLPNTELLRLVRTIAELEGQRADLLAACKAAMTFAHGANTTEGDAAYDMLCAAIARAKGGAA